LGLSDAKWEDKEEEKEQQQHPLDDMKQRSLSEFLS
jgi:hypothetical protein